LERARELFENAVETVCAFIFLLFLISKRCWCIISFNFYIEMMIWELDYV
jgi:hypothetical protein